MVRHTFCFLLSSRCHGRWVERHTFCLLLSSRCHVIWVEWHTFTSRVWAKRHTVSILFLFSFSIQSFVLKWNVFSFVFFIPHFHSSWQITFFSFVSLYLNQRSSRCRFSPFLPAFAADRLDVKSYEKQSQKKRAISWFTYDAICSFSSKLYVSYRNTAIILFYPCKWVHQIAFATVVRAMIT